MLPVPKKLVALLLATATGTGFGAPEVLLRETFDDSSAPSLLRERLGKHPDVSLDPTAGPDGSAALRVVYRGNDEGSTGMSETVRLARGTRSATLSYDVKFEDGFDFSRGGKLPGLGPENPVTGGDPMKPAGWSARPMWREDGLLTSYTYHQDKPDRTGDYARSEGFLLERGRWHSVAVVVVLNSGPEEKDGSVEIHVDGTKRVGHRGLRLWKGESGKTGPDIARLLFTTFHGGNDSSWAPKNADGSFRDVVAWFDNVEVVAE